MPLTSLEFPSAREIFDTLEAMGFDPATDLDLATDGLQSRHGDKTMETLAKRTTHGLVALLLFLAAPAAWGYCDSVADGVWDASAAQHELQALAEINAMRQRGASCGGEAMAPVPPLTMDPRLQCAARNHSYDLGTEFISSHMNPNEPDQATPYKRAFLAGFPKSATCGMPGPDEACVLENISWGYPTASEVVNGHWAKSDGHCKNLMTPNDNLIGVGFYPSGYWTVVIGKQ